jgi:hypothetical protein
VIDLDKDACAKLGGIPCVVQSVDGGGAAADTGCSLKNGDVDGVRRSGRVET